MLRVATATTRRRVESYSYSTLRLGVVLHDSRYNDDEDASSRKRRGRFLASSASPPSSSPWNKRRLEHHPSIHGPIPPPPSSSQGCHSYHLWANNIRGLRIEGDSLAEKDRLARQAARLLFIQKQTSSSSISPSQPPSSNQKQNKVDGSSPTSTSSMTPSPIPQPPISSTVGDSGGGAQKIASPSPPPPQSPPPTVGTTTGGAAEKSEKVVKLALGGNVVITAAKFCAWLHSGSSAMLSESIHSLVDCGNQTLLLIGIRAASTAPDRHHQYGYGKSIYFWSLVSALGTFWLGAGVSLRNSFQDLLNPTVQLEEITWDVWGVLGISFFIDGTVLSQTLQLLRASKPAHLTFMEHLRRIRDPTTLAVMLEDSGACIGVVMAILGIGFSQATGNPVYDSIGGVCISSLLAAMGLALARLNERYLLGQAVDPEIVEGIRTLLMARPGIDNVQSVQSQWIGPYTFAYKAEVDFDGTYLAAKLMARYEDEFLGSNRLKEDLPVLLAFYAEDVVRTLEREVREVEREIRALYPEAQFIELEPASKDATAFAIDGHREKMLRELEHVTLNQLLIAIAKTVVKGKKKDEQPTKKKE